MAIAPLVVRCVTISMNLLLFKSIKSVEYSDRLVLVLYDKESFYDNCGVSQL